VHSRTIFVLKTGGLYLLVLNDTKAERTGWSIFNDLWPYVLLCENEKYMIATSIILWTTKRK
jgi:hypothetical protein